MDKIGSAKAKEKLLEIAEDLANISSIQAFVDNMMNAKLDREMTPFEWWETYLAWSEVSTENDMENYYGE